MIQQPLNLGQYPKTRYQGSKRKLLPWIYDVVKKSKFDSVLDLCGGTAVISYFFKKMGKEVTYNDILKFNYWIGTALIENSRTKLNKQDVNFILENHNNIEYNDFIQHTFRDIYYTDEENAFLDRVANNINQLGNNYSYDSIIKYKKAIAYYALFQSCIIKRPFNLFHRKNLNIRLNDVKRSFGNKKTWDRSFEHYFKIFVKEANEHIFDNNKKNKSLNFDAHIIPKNCYDLVYIDPPYLSIEKPSGICNYFEYYHFLEGITDYENWKHRINIEKKNLPLIANGYNWNYKHGNIEGFEKIIKKFQDSKILISYKTPGIPSIKELKEILLQYKKKVNVYKKSHYYALNKNNGHYKEILISAK
jgi:adenine-specific DNA methylase